MNMERKTLVRCFWCHKLANVNSVTGACYDCHEQATRLMERHKWVDWFFNGLLIITAAAVVGTIIWMMKPL